MMYQYMVIALQDPADEVRYDALMALQMIGDPIALPAMEALLQDASPLVRKAAQKYTTQLRSLMLSGGTAQ
jgi:HEAT repeat protein